MEPIPETQKQPNSDDDNDASAAGGDAMILVDRISNLPEPIICHILSFLPIKSVVQTSLLSRSWRYHWTKMTDFHLEEQQLLLRPAVKLEKFVGNFLPRLNVEVSMNKLHVTIKNPSFRHDYLHKWINTAISRNVRVLILDLPYGPCFDGYGGEFDKFQLPGELYTCRTIEVLKLSGWFFLAKLYPGSVSLPKLTHLELGYIKYDSDESLPNLISGALVLESLSIRRRGCDNMTVCTISSPVLRRIIYLHGSAPYNPLHCKLVIDTPALESLNLYDFCPTEIIFQQALTCLDRVEVDVVSSTHDRVRIHVHSTPQEDTIVGLIRACGRMKSKKMRCSSKAMARLMAGANEKLISSFGRVTELWFGIEGCDQLSCLTDLIDSCTALESLVIFNCRWRKQSQSRYWRDPSTAPKCFSSSLTSFSFLGFEGTEDEITMLKFILNHALVMKRFVIKRSGDLNPYSGEELSSLKRTFVSSAVPPTCEVSIS